MQRNALESRKAQSLSLHLHRDLSLYALAASAAGVSVLALAPNANAQIVYTPADEKVSFGQEIRIDLNHDGIIDLGIREALYTSSIFPRHELRTIPAEGNGVVAFENDFFLVVAAAPGDIIGSSGHFTPNAAAMATITTGGFYYAGAWINVKNRYLGIMLQIDGKRHFGWARLNTTPFQRNNNIHALLTGYAYETQPNTPIRAGDTGVDDGGAVSDHATNAGTLGALALGSTGK